MFRYLGFFFEFQQYWWQSPNAFQLSGIFKNDPTETAFISNRIGRAFADYLAKRIYGAHFTHSYEEAMILNGFQVKGKRPDFYCDNLQQQFAIEAKGYKRASVSDNDMTTHKKQSQSGGISVNFSVASVAFNLYKNPKIKFYDPVNDSTEYNSEINLQLRSRYFNRVLEALSFFNIEPARSNFADYYSYNIPLFFFSEYQLLIHRAIVEREWNGNSWLNAIEISSEENNEYYIDLDGIGLMRQ